MIIELTGDLRVTGVIVSLSRLYRVNLAHHFALHIYEAVI